MCGREQTHNEVQLASCCCVLEGEEDHLSHPRHKVDALGTHAPSLEGHRFVAVDGAAVDILHQGVRWGNRTHASILPRVLRVQLGRNASVVDRCG